MKNIILAIAVVAGTLPTVAMAQDAPAIQPYIGLLGAREIFDAEHSASGIPAVKHNSGGVVEVVGGVNFSVPGLGKALVVGVEGSAGKGVRGTIDWQYGLYGRVGLRAGQDSMFFGKVGRRWTQFDVANAKTYHGISAGGGVELSALDMGADSDSPIAHMKVRFQAETFENFRSVRPAAGVVVGF